MDQESFNIYMYMGCPDVIAKFLSDGGCKTKVEAKVMLEPFLSKYYDRIRKLFDYDFRLECANNCIEKSLKSFI